MRRLKRLAEGTLSSYRRLFLLLLCVCVVFYMLPPIFRYIFLSAPEQKGEWAPLFPFSYLLNTHVSLQIPTACAWTTG